MIAALIAVNICVFAIERAVKLSDPAAGVACECASCQGRVDPGPRAARQVAGARPGESGIVA